MAVADGADGRVRMPNYWRLRPTADESAFTVLVRRHGPLVWAVPQSAARTDARRVSGHVSDLDPSATTSALRRKGRCMVSRIASPKRSELPRRRTRTTAPEKRRARVADCVGSIAKRGPRGSARLPEPLHRVCDGGRKASGEWARHSGGNSAPCPGG